VFKSLCAYFQFSTVQKIDIYKLNFEYAGVKYVIDASADPPEGGKKSFGRLFNFGRQPHHANCKLYPKMLYNVGGYERKLVVFIVSDRAIPKGNQLLWQYKLPQYETDAYALAANCRCDSCKAKWKNEDWKINGKPMVERKSKK
jgi:hypothetical protein